MCLNITLTHRPACLPAPIQSQESDEYSVMGVHQAPLLRESAHQSAAGEDEKMERNGSFNYQVAMDNIVIRTFQFPVK